MQTFLPVPDFEESARILDYRRLGKQRVEALMILRILSGQPEKEGKRGWANHPATRMWRGHGCLLQHYAYAMCEEWGRRGYKNTIIPEILDFRFEKGSCADPWWIGNATFHLTHQSNLVRKFPEHYRPFFPDVPDDLPYLWPIGA